MCPTSAERALREYYSWNLGVFENEKQEMIVVGLREYYCEFGMDYWSAADKVQLSEAPMALLDVERALGVHVCSVDGPEPPELKTKKLMRTIERREVDCMELSWEMEQMKENKLDLTQCELSWMIANDDTRLNRHKMEPG